MGILNRPVLRRAAEIALDIARDARRNNADREQQVTAITERMAADPVVANQTNSEPWYKSRVYIGIGVALLGQGLAWFGVEPEAADDVLLSEIVTAIGSLIALIGRSVKNAGPIVWWKPWTLFGIGR